MSLDYEGNLMVQNYFSCRLLTVAYDPHVFVGIAVNGTTFNSSGNYTLYIILNSFTGFRSMGAGQCGNDRPGFGVHSITQKLSAYNIIRV